MLEKSLGRLDGVASARMGQSKFFYEIKVKEAKTLLPSAILDMVKKLEDYAYVGMTITEISGTAEKSGADYVLVARGSNQKYVLKPTEALKKLVGEGKAKVTLAGKLSQEKDKVTIEVAEVKAAK